MLADTKYRKKCPAKDLAEKFGHGVTADTIQAWEFEGMRQAVIQTSKNDYMEVFRVYRPQWLNRRKIDDAIEEGQRQVTARAWAITVSPPKGTLTREVFEYWAEMSRVQSKGQISWFPSISPDGHRHLHGTFLLYKKTDGMYKSEIKRWLQGNRAIKVFQHEIKPLHFQKIF